MKILILVIITTLALSLAVIGQSVSSDQATDRSEDMALNTEAAVF